MNLLHSLFHRVTRLHTSRQCPRPKPSRMRLAVESLEDRCVPSTVTEFSPLPSANAAPTGITTASDGSLWFTANAQTNVSRIGSITSTGVIHEIPTAQSASSITGIVGGPDGNLWVSIVSTQWGDSVAKVTTAGWGSFTNYKLLAGSGPQY